MFEMVNKLQMYLPMSPNTCQPPHISQPCGLFQINVIKVHLLQTVTCTRCVVETAVNLWPHLRLPYNISGAIIKLDRVQQFEIGIQAIHFVYVC